MQPPLKRRQFIIDIGSKQCIHERCKFLGFVLNSMLCDFYIGSDDYGRMIGDLCQQHSSWVVMEGAVFGSHMADLLTSNKYEVHACIGEAFSISTAEMVKAGCIVFAPCEGGQADILDNSTLLYSDIDDVVEKIDQVLSNEGLQSELRVHLAARGKEFSTEHFIMQAQYYVEQFLSDANTSNQVMYHGKH